MKKHPILSSAVVVVIVLLFLELVIRLFGWAGPDRLFIAAGPADAGGTRMVSEPRRVPQFLAAQEFVHPAPPDVTRIWVMGGSTAFGVHYAPRGTIPRWLELMLNTDQTEIRFEVLNAGVPGASMEHIARWAPEILAYSPSLVILLTGHNEIIHESLLLPAIASHPAVGGAQRVLRAHSALYRGLRGLVRGLTRARARRQWTSLQREGLEEPILTESRLAARVRATQGALTRVTGLAREAGVPLVVVSLPANEKDWEPSVSVRPPPAVRTAAETRMAQGRKALVTNRPQDAIAKFTAALDLAPHHAASHFFLGRAYYETGDYAAARTHYRAAIRHDGFPTRIHPDIEAALAATAQDEGVMYVNGRELFAEASAHNIINADLIDDAVHPTLKGQHLLATKLRDIVLDQTAPEGSLAGTPSAITLDRGPASLGMDDAYLFARHMAIGMFMVTGPVLPRYHRAIPHFQHAAALSPDNPTPALAEGYMQIMQHRAGEATRAFNRVLGNPTPAVYEFVAQYFANYVDLRPPTIRVRRRTPGPFGFQVKKPLGEAPLVLKTLGREEFVFYRSSITGETQNISLFLKGKLAEREALIEGGGRIPDTLLALTPEGVVGKGDTLIVRKSSTATAIQAQGPDPQVIYGEFPGRGVNPLVIRTATVRLKAAPAAGAPAPRLPQGEIYWRTAYAKDFTDDYRFQFDIVPDGGWHDYTIPLDRIPVWVVSDPVTQLRLDPANFAGELSVGEILFTPWSPE